MRSVQNKPLCAQPALKNGYHFQVIFQKVDEHVESILTGILKHNMGLVVFE